MDGQDARPPGARQSVLIALAVAAALGWSTVSGDLLRPLFGADWIRGVPYLRSGLIQFGDVVAMVAVVALAAQRSAAAVLRLSGIGRFEPRQLVWGLAAFPPVLAACALFLPVASHVSAKDFVYPGVLGPFLEELFYRGLAVGLLMRLCGWPFAAAALLPALFFGAAHLWQGTGALDTLGVFAVTAVGGLGFGWLFVRWDFSLWPPVMAHIGMNCIWTAFALGETALGGKLGNAVRVSEVLLLVGTTLWLTRRSPVFGRGRPAAPPRDFPF